MPNVRDMLGQPYSRYRCDQAVAEVYRRAGVALPPWAAPESAEDYHELLRQIHEADTWVRVGTVGLPRYLDLILCQRDNGAHGVAVMLSSQQALTSTPDRGVHTLPHRGLRRIIATYRPRAAGVPR